MTERAALTEDPAPALPLHWWARGLNLRERLDARRPPAVRRRAAGAVRPGVWAAGDRAGVTARLAALDLSADLAGALDVESPRQLADRTAKPAWAHFIEQAVAAAPQSAEPTRAATATTTTATATAAATSVADTTGTASAPGTATATSPTPETSGSSVFIPALLPLIDLAWQSVAERLTLPAVDHAAVHEGFARRLGAQLAGTAARTLVTELSRERAASALTGTTPQERFASFIARLGTRDGLSALFTQYPVLARVLGQAALDAADATTELTSRLHADREQIAAELFPTYGPRSAAELGALIRVDLGRGDAHQGNRSVAILRFTGGSAVYKPRPSAHQELLREAVDWLNGKVDGLDLRSPRTVCGEDYGWMEHIEHRWCSSVTEADRFYRRQGALLALLYAIDGTDVHCENLIAGGDQPVLVDAETLFHTGLPFAATAGADPAAEALQASVHRTGLLPQPVIGDNGALDLSALGRTQGGLDPSNALCWADAGTDTMRAVRGPVPGIVAQNQPLPPRAADRPAGHADHRAALLDGFRAGYDAIAGHRQELLDVRGVLPRWSQRPARLIVRATRLYATLLGESLHPDLLRDALARDAVFALLWTESVQDPARQELIEDEIADLWRGDIPVFFHRPAQTAVWTSRGSRLDGLLPVPALEAVVDKIAAMNEVDRYDQEWVITAALAVSGAYGDSAGPRSQLARRPAAPVEPTQSRLLAAACGIADELSARAVRSRGRANWLGLERVDGRHWTVLPMGGGLAEGYSGAALFLAQTGALAKAERYTALAREAVRPLPLLLACMAEDPELSAAVGPGALNGLGGLVYTVARLGRLLEEDEVGFCLPQAVAALGHAADALTDQPLDEAGAGLADGLSGALAAAVLAHEAADADGEAYRVRADRLARRLADRLLAHAEPLTAAEPLSCGPLAREPLTAEPAGHAGSAAHIGPTGHARLAGPAAPGARTPGFAEGAAGLGWALLRYAASPAFAADAQRHAAVGTALLRSALDSALTAGDPTWYSGLAGVALAAADVLGPELGEADHCVKLLADPARTEDLSLRQGALGRLEPLLVLAERGHAGAREALTRRTGAVLGLAEQQGHPCGTPDHVPTPGLLTGLSGIGYSLLRLGFPETVPSIALLDHTAGQPRPQANPALPDLPDPHATAR